MTTFKTSDFKIVTCECFCYPWKKIKETNDDSWKFDEIENGKHTFRKMFGDEKIIFHCCYSCMEKSILMNDAPFSDSRYCSYSIKHDGGKLANICNGCIWLVIQRNKHDFFMF